MGSVTSTELVLPGPCLQHSRAARGRAGCCLRGSTFAYTGEAASVPRGPEEARGPWAAGGYP